MKLLRLLISIFILLFVSGCATWTHHGITTNHDKKICIAVVPVAVTVEISSASEIMSQPPETADNKQLINAQMANVADKLTATLISRLRESTYFDVVTVPLEDVVQHGGDTAIAPLWNIKKLQYLRQSVNAQAVLAVSIVGYGKIKKEWLTFMIGTGIAEGVVQGIVAARIIGNTWVGVAVALEEIGQEILVWGGGSHFFNKRYSPVTLQAKLTSTSDGALVWDDTVFVRADKDAIRLLPEEEQNKKEVQLSVTAMKAINKVATDVINKAKSNIRDRNL